MKPGMTAFNQTNLQKLISRSFLDTADSHVAGSWLVMCLEQKGS